MSTSLPNFPLFTLDEATQNTLVLAANSLIEILTAFKDPPNKDKQKKLEARNPFAIYLGYGGALLGLIHALRGMERVTGKMMRDIVSTQTATFINDVITSLIQGVNRVDIQDDANTLLFGQFCSALLVLDEIREQFPILSATNHKSIQRLLPNPESAGTHLLAIYAKHNSTTFFPEAECEPFYGRCGLAAAALALRASIVRRRQPGGNNAPAAGAAAAPVDPMAALAQFAATGAATAAAALTAADNVANELQLLAQRLIAEAVSKGEQQAKHYFSDEQRAAGAPTMCWAWHRSLYCGAAHGAAGILYYALTVHRNGGPHQVVPKLLDALQRLENAAKFSDDSGNYRPALQLPISNTSDKKEEKDELVQFCHGAPGFAFTFARAFDHDARSWKEKMLRASEVTWSRGLLKDSVGLCHGVSGNMFVFLAVARSLVKRSKAVSDTAEKQETEKEATRQWNRAVAFALEASKLAPEVHTKCDTIYSLYEGLAGALAAIGAVLQCSAAKSFDVVGMPGFEIVS